MPGTLAWSYTDTEAVLLVVAGAAVTLLAIILYRAWKAARITPEMAGLERTTLDHFIGGDIETNKALLLEVLTGLPGARRDIVLLNAAAVLVAAGLTDDLKQGVAMAAEAIDSGQAAATLEKLRQFGAKHAPKQ